MYDGERLSERLIMRWPHLVITPSHHQSPTLLHTAAASLYLSRKAATSLHHTRLQPLSLPRGCSNPRTRLQPPSHIRLQAVAPLDFLHHARLRPRQYRRAPRRCLRLTLALPLSLPLALALALALAPALAIALAIALALALALTPALAQP